MSQALGRGVRISIVIPTRDRRAWVRVGGRHPEHFRRWPEWAAGWGAAAVSRMTADHDRILADPLARRGLTLLQHLTRVTYGMA